MGWIRTRIGGLGAALAMLALALQVCAPNGFMISRQAGAPALVVCTGHGPLLVAAADDHGRPSKAPASSDQGVCAFAGHGLTTLADAAPAAIAVSFAFARPPVSTPTYPSPGRGLAAPPPPSQAPPLRTV